MRLKVGGKWMRWCLSVSLIKFLQWLLCCWKWRFFFKMETDIFICKWMLAMVATLNYKYQEFFKKSLKLWACLTVVAWNTLISGYSGPVLPESRGTFIKLVSRLNHDNYNFANFHFSFPHFLAFHQKFLFFFYNISNHLLEFIRFIKICH